MNKEEFRTSEILLDLGVAIPFRPLRFFSKNKEGKSKVVIRRPYMGGLLRIARIYLSIGVSYKELKEYSPDEAMTFMAVHGEKVSELVTCAVLRGYFSYLLFHKPVSWLLRWRVHPIFLMEAMIQLQELTNITPFWNIIRLAETMNLLQPRLSH